MADLSNFPITQKWVPKNTDIIQLFSYPTPNGVKVSIALEEMGLVYEPHLVTLSDADVKSAAFLSLNPRVRTHNQNMTVAARAMAERNTVGDLS
jgi:GST-like protein